VASLEARVDRAAPLLEQNHARKRSTPPRTRLLPAKLAAQDVERGVRFKVADVKAGSAPLKTKRAKLGH
jgi:hypothetical protein